MEVLLGRPEIGGPNAVGLLYNVKFSLNNGFL